MNTSVIEPAPYFTPHIPTAQLVPFLTPDSVHLFVDAEVVEPWIDRASGLPTSALKFGVRFDMLGAATTQEMYDTGTADVTDSIDFHAGLDKVFYKTKNGKVHALDVHWLNKDAVFEPSETTAGRLILETEVTLDPLGVPTNWFDKVVHWWHNHFGYRQMVPAMVTGIIDRDMGAVEMHGAVGEHTGIELVGYTMYCQRINLNRRPSQPSVPA